MERHQSNEHTLGSGACLISKMESAWKIIGSAKQALRVNDDRISNTKAMVHQVLKTVAGDPMSIHQINDAGANSMSYVDWSRVRLVIELAYAGHSSLHFSHILLGTLQATITFYTRLLGSRYEAPVQSTLH